jgi:putative transposase
VPGQYTSLDFTNRLHELGLVPFYGSTGDCYDNAAMETFWATLKRELSWIHGPLIYMNRARLRSCPLRLIEIFYNQERAQAGLGHLSPLDYEAALVVALNPTRVHRSGSTPHPNLAVEDSRRRQ